MCEQEKGRNLVDCSLYDEATDAFFNIRVSAEKARELNYDQLKAYRIIQSLKAQGQVPVKKGVPPKDTGAVPKQRGNLRWTLAATRDLLNLCSTVRHLLRSKKVPLEVFDSVSKQLNHIGKHQRVDATQCRDKMRALKKAKDEQSNGNAWEFLPALRFIYESPLDQDKTMMMAADQTEASCTPWGRTYTVNQPKFVTSAELSKVETPRGPWGKTYTVNQPKIVTAGDDAETSSTPWGITYVVDQPKIVTTTEQAQAIDVESEDLGCLTSDDLETTFIFSNKPTSDNNLLVCPNDEPDHGSDHLQTSSLPSETFFANNLNANSTPERNDHAEFMSPSKKKTTSGPAGNRTPRSTPRRKKRFETALWSQEITHALMKECIQRKEYLQTNNPPNRIWKEICDELIKCGYKCEWQACREKFENMSSFFEHSMIKVNGILGQIKWPYYNAFLQLHDLPLGYQFQLEGEEQAADESDEHPDAAIQLLISLYRERRHLLKSSKSHIKHSTLYQEISTGMKNFDYQMTSKQCQNKMNRLLDKFHKEHDRVKNKSGESPSTWEWFSIFLEMEEGCPNLDAPFVISTGSKTHFSSHGSEQLLVDKRSTRTRITASKNVTRVLSEEENDDDPQPTGKGKKPVKKQLYRNWVQELEEKKAKSKADMVEEVRMMRLSQQENYGPKNQALATMAKAMVDISTFLNQSAKQNQSEENP